MSKYSFEFKKKVVKAYLNGEGGYGYLSKTYGVPAQRSIEEWVHNYQKFGDVGLIRSRKNQTYSFEKKLTVVELYLSSEISYQDLALQEGITNPSMIVNWVKRFRVAGPDALRPHKKGQGKTLEKPEKKSSTLPIESPVDTSAEHVKELEDELLKQRIENAFLKELKRFDRENPDKVLEETILAIRASNKDYGYRRVVGELNNQGYKVNKKKVQRIMQKLGLQVTSFTRKSRKYSSYKGKVGTVAPNRIKRRFNTHIPHQKITTDTTELKYYEVDTKGHMTMHKLYLDPFMDMCNGEILSFGIDKHPSAKNVMDALEQAIEITSDCPYRRTFHSDQGWAYQMKAYSHRLKQEHIFQSMSRKGNCLDNSVMENFFGLLKQEIYYGVVYYSYEELKAEIERYIKYYNEQRIKEKLGWMSPVQYRLHLLAA